MAGNSICYRIGTTRCLAAASRLVANLTAFAALASFCGVAESGWGAENTAADSVVAEHAAAVELCREYLGSGSRAEREKLLPRLAEYDEQIESILRALAARPTPEAQAGYFPSEKFVTPEMRRKYPDKRLYFLVPESYRADRPTGLIVFLHGGGIDTTRTAPSATLRMPTRDSPSDSSRSGDVLAATGMITVGPSAPGKGKSSYRWCLRTNDTYLADVVEECRQRFHIDADRVFLLGHSMGGFGAYHHALRQPDRYAGIVVSSGSWDRGYWPAIRGTPLCFVNGVNDARRGERWHYTDVEYGRWTDKILKREQLDHVYYEHEGEHGISENREQIAAYFAAAKKVRRDPYYPRVTLASPQGFSANYLRAVRHNRWLTLDEATEGSLVYDELVERGGRDFDAWRLEHVRRKRPGAMIDAINEGDNTITITTRNVARFRVWLHPKMIDVERPVRIEVDGVLKFDQRVKPSLATALESYQRRGDWGLIYPMQVELQIEED